MLKIIINKKIIKIKKVYYMFFEKTKIIIELLTLVYNDPSIDTMIYNNILYAGGN